MNKSSIFIGILILIAAIAVYVLFQPQAVSAPTDGTTATTTEQSGDDALLTDLIVPSSPLPGATVASPLIVTGKARGTWYFEASFPVVLEDANGTVLAQAPAQAQGDWMTTDFVPFAVTLTFVAPMTTTGTLILKKDNPSGDPSKDQSISIPVRF